MTIDQMIEALNKVKAASPLGGVPCRSPYDLSRVDLVGQVAQVESVEAPAETSTTSSTLLDFPLTPC